MPIRLPSLNRPFSWIPRTTSFGEISGTHTTGRRVGVPRLLQLTAKPSRSARRNFVSIPMMLSCSLAAHSVVDSEAREQDSIIGIETKFLLADRDGLAVSCRSLGTPTRRPVG